MNRRRTRDFAGRRRSGRACGAQRGGDECRAHLVLICLSTIQLLNMPNRNSHKGHERVFKAPPSQGNATDAQRAYDLREHAGDLAAGINVERRQLGYRARLAAPECEIWSYRVTQSGQDPGPPADISPEVDDSAALCPELEGTRLA